MPGTRELTIEGHKLVALLLNPDAAGEPVILLHGIIGSPGFWRTKALSQMFLAQGPCYALTLPGHYPAAFPAGFRKEELSAELIARLLTAAIRELAGDRPVTLAGYSTGGFAALAVGAYTPAVARRIVSIAGFAHGQWGGMLGNNQRMARSGTIGHALFKLFYISGRLNRTVFSWGWRIYLADARAFYAYDDLDELMDNCYADFGKTDLEAMIQYFSVMPDIDITPMLPRVTASTLAIAGDSDPIVPPAQARLIADKVPNAELALLQGAGHCAFAERASAYQRALSDWLRKTSSEA